MILRGSVQLYPPNSVQSIPGSFSLVTAGPKLRMEIDARPAIVFKQIYDGQQSYSSMPNVEMPPLTKFGLGALARFDQPGYQITAIADKKKQRGFRLVDPEGYTTDFYLDPKTGRVMSFLSLLRRRHARHREQQIQGSGRRAGPVQFLSKVRDADGSFLCGVQCEGSETQPNTRR